MTTASMTTKPTAPPVDLHALLTDQRSAAGFLMDELPSEGRRAVEMLFLDGLGVDDVAGDLGLTLEAAEDLVDRTVELLRCMAWLLFPEMCRLESRRKDDAA